MSLGMPETSFRGNGVSPGVAVGRALKLDSHNRFVLKTPIAKADLEAEVQRFRHALQVSREQLENLKIRLEEKVGKDHSVILESRQGLGVPSAAIQKRSGHSVVFVVKDNISHQVTIEPGIETSGWIEIRW